MIFLNEKLRFPSPEYADEDGLLAIGGDLSVERLILAYNSGIFPWYSERQPILWWCPDPRMVLFPDEFKISKSLRQVLNKGKFTITFNQNFIEVVSRCASIERKGQSGTWITSEMKAAYFNLHELGHAVSIEVWQNEKLVGGLYGIDLKKKKVFCGESMFSLESNASKVAFYHLVEYCKLKGYRLIDCQIYNDFLFSLGARELSRRIFLQYLKA